MRPVRTSIAAATTAVTMTAVVWSASDAAGSNDLPQGSVDRDADRCDCAHGDHGDESDQHRVLEQVLALRVLQRRRESIEPPVHLFSPAARGPLAPGGQAEADRPVPRD